MERGKYIKEFKNEIVQLVLRSDKSAIEIAKDLGIKKSTIYSWIRRYSSQEDLKSELKQLRAENKVLKQERDILKKATAYFAKETL